MYTNGVNTYTPVKEDKPKLQSQSFDFEGESFSEMMEKEQPAGKGLRETAQELAEDESVLSTDEENLAMAKRGKNTKAAAETAQKPQPEKIQDQARLLRLMDMSNKLNLSNINISKSKKEIENTVGPSIEENDEKEDITSVVAKMAVLRQETEDVESADIEADTEDSTEDFEEKKEQDNSQVLHETEEELKEDMSILSTEEENLEMARRNSAVNTLTDEDYKTSEEDMVFLGEITALNNQMTVEKQNQANQINPESILNALTATDENTDENYVNMSELSGEDVDYIIKMLQEGTADASDFTDDNKEMAVLSDKFLTLLRDSIINKKVFRIDFDNQISVIIRISNDGKINAEFQTNDEAIETYLKNNLHLLKQRFEALNVNYGEIKSKNTAKES